MAIQSLGVSRVLSDRSSSLRSSFVQRSVLFAVAALLGILPAQAQEIGTLTLLKDSPLHVIRGASVLQGVEGMRLHAGDIFETGPAPGAQAQLEFTGGAIVELGPSTAVLITSAGAASGDMLLASGWLKGETTAGVYRYSSPLASASTKGGNVLLHCAGDAADIFVEHGNATVTGGAAPIPSGTGKIFFARKGGKPIVAADRPSGEFIGAMPIPFRDALPSRLDRFKAKPPIPKPDHDVTYADIERWLLLPAAMRRGFAARFKSRLQDPAFRQAIEAHESTLPEWGPYLHPDDFKTGPAAAGKPSTPPGD